MIRTRALSADGALWEQMLLADEANLTYFAQRVEMPGVSLFCAERHDAPEFDLALVYRVPNADSALLAVCDYFRERGRCPRVRLSPLSRPADWPQRLERAGFVEAGERFVYFSTPRSLQLSMNPDIRVERVVSGEDGDRFSAIQVIGFAIPPAHREWDRQLIQRHLITGQHSFYLAWLDGQAVGAMRSVQQPGGMTVMAALASHPAAQRRGVGTSLLARIIEDARKAGSHVIFGAVVPGSYASGMYERLGFAFHFETRTFVEDAGRNVRR